MHNVIEWNDAQADVLKLKHAVHCVEDVTLDAVTYREPDLVILFSLT